MAAFATVQDYQVREKVTLDGAETAQVAALLDDASALIRGRMPTGYEPAAEVARAVAVAVVRRTLANPGGRRSVSVGGYSETLGEGGGMYLTDRELDDLLAGAESSTAYTVDALDEGLLDHPNDRPAIHSDGW